VRRQHRSPLRLIALASTLFILIALPRSARAEPATLCGKGGYGESFASASPYSNDDKFREHAENYERQMEQTLLTGARPRHLAARSAAGPLKLSLETQERFFREVFGAKGDIVRICGLSKLVADNTKAKASVMADQSAEQCRALRDAETIRGQAQTSLEQLRRELKEKFGDPREARADQASGARFTQLARAKEVNEKEISAAGGLLPNQVAGLRQEAGRLWGANASDEKGAYSAALVQGAREFGRVEALQKQLQAERVRLGSSLEKCGSLGLAENAPPTGAEKRPATPDGGGADRSGSGASTSLAGGASPAQGPGSESSFLGKNWPWLAGGTVLAAAGGGAYLLHERAERQADDAKAEAAWNEEIALKAAQAHAATSIETSTSTSTSTATGTDTDTGQELFAPLRYTVAELETLELSFVSPESSALSLKNAPAGSDWETSTSTFRWIPALGQAGAHAFTITSFKGQQPVEVTVTARDREALKNSGPPDNFRDGDIGYVFVHGAGGTVDRCAAGNDLFEYWGAAPALVAPDSNSRKLACYDGREDVASQAKRVAEQIDGFDCGRYRRCVIITHSMGGLLIEHMFTHTEAAPAGDPNPKFYENAALNRKVRDKTLFVISLASAAGGSKVADILISGSQQSAMQKISGFLARRVGSTNNAYKNLQSKYASEVVAPIARDPGVPFFMVPGYSKRTLYEERGFFDIISLDIGTPNAKIFNGDSSCASLDYIAGFNSRSDGLVDFRSACGAADANPETGPGYAAPLVSQIAYCATAAKKPNHYPWFVINLNHYDITMPTYHCGLRDNPCETMLFRNGTFEVEPAYAQKSAVEVLRDRLTRNQSGKKPVQLRTVLGL
jgi:hypothetical protein